MRDLTFAGIWMVLLPLSLVSTPVGVLLWVWVALLQPNTLLFGFMAGVPFNKLVALITLGRSVLVREDRQPYFDTAQLLLFLFGVSATLSWCGSLAPSADGTELYQKLLKIIALAFTITTVMHTRTRIHLLVVVITLSLGFLATEEGLISLLTAGGHKIVGSPAVGDNNSLAAALLMIIPLLYYLMRYSAVTVVKLGMTAVLGLSIVTVVMSFSRGGFLGLMVLGAVMVKNSRRKLASLALVALTGLVIVTAAPEAWFQRLDTIEAADNDASFMGRVVAWKISLLIALDNPFFGGGMHAVQYQPVWNAFTPLLDRLDFIATPPPDEMPHAAHSIYFEVLGDLGFIGLALFLALLGNGFWNCHRIHRLTRDDPSLEWARDLARMLQISLLIYVVTAAALSMAYFELLYILLAIASRCLNTVRITLAEGDPGAVGYGASAPIRAWQARVPSQIPAMTRATRPHHGL